MAARGQDRSARGVDIIHGKGDMPKAGAVDRTRGLFDEFGIVEKFERRPTRAITG